MPDSRPELPPATLSQTPVSDLLIGLGLVLVAAAAALALPEGSMLRLALGALGILAPGYLLIQACIVPVRPLRERGLHVVLSLAVGPAFVGMVALLTGAMPGSFTPTAIISLVVVASALCAGGAWYRRSPLAERRRVALDVIRTTRRNAEPAALTVSADPEPAAASASTPPTPSASPPTSPGPSTNAAGSLAASAPDGRRLVPPPLS